ncbi:MAG: tricarballylate utilization 4Fe-4S protein TcuB, partial [Desulfovibrionaceae bacterium]|nr:tricarballylate utilization 4Fe-4S protein TcuB [Desulfovibrionaceae bacterium]
EGFCAVFPVMELRRTFTDAELKYFANLCHNCRGCYYACQYAPPHEFDLNYPEVMAQLRRETYEEFAWPKALAPALRMNGLYVFAVSLIGVLLFLGGSLLANGPEALFGTHPGPGSFYNLFPYSLLLVLFTLVFLFGAFSLYKGVKNFWATTESKPEELWSLKNHKQALKDAFTLRYLDGNGEGCNYPDDRFSTIRRKYHHLTFYGFLACLASTSIAFIMDHLLGMPAPYSFFSLPVLFGTGGGIALCIGTAGLMYLKCKMDRRPYDEQSVGMDVSFAMLLFLVCLTGLALLVFRSTSLMGILLCVHLGLVLALFFTFATSKFVHIAYRYFALVRNAYEIREANSK